MKDSIITKYHNLSIRKKVTTRGLAILGVLILLIVSLTYYGTQTGNFVIRVNNAKSQGLSLSSKEDYADPTERLVATPLKDCIDGCYDFIPENIEDGIGSKNDSKGRYLAYSFYLLNGGTLATNYTLEYKITRVTKNVDSILRVMLIQDGERSFYSKARAEDEGTNPVNGEPIWGIPGYNGVEAIKETTAFVGDTIAFKTFYDFQVGQSTKFTVVMWLDGFDKENPDGNRSMLGAGLKTELNFSVIG